MVQYREKKRTTWSIEGKRERVGTFTYFWGRKNARANEKQSLEGFKRTGDSLKLLRSGGAGPAQQKTAFDPFGGISMYGKKAKPS